MTCQPAPEVGQVAPLAHPFVKWAGGKRQLLGQYEPLLPREITHYWEPMAGGAAVFWCLRPRITGHPIISDVNTDLMCTYRALRDRPGALLGKLECIAGLHSEPYYYEIRALDPGEMTDIERAARFLYLCRAGYNGLWRVNFRGRHNVPIGRNSHGAIYPGAGLFDVDNLRACSAALQGVELRTMRHDDPVMGALEFPDYLIVVDPPYAPANETSFTRYQQDAFGYAEHIALARVLTDWHGQGARIFLSNSDVPLVRELYQEPIWNLTEVTARQPIAASKDKRGVRRELAIRNYHT